MICSEIVQPSKPDKMIRVKGRGYICSLVIRMGVISQYFVSLEFISEQVQVYFLESLNHFGS